ncbi:hypothetical protein CVT24_006465, partial [Panaeolus cyanescens]
DKFLESKTESQSQSQPRALTAEEKLQVLEQENAQANIELRQKLVSNKETLKSYSRHISNYEKWFIQKEKDRHQSNPAWIPDSPHPITATKATQFLNYELNRLKVKRAFSGKELNDTSLGRSSIQQAINALEWHRKTHQREPQYMNDPASSIPLRMCGDIRDIELGSKSREPERQAKSQDMKIKGVTSRTFETKTLVEMANDYLSKPKGKSKVNIYCALRDRAMLLLSTSMAFRGNNTRKILLSDIQTEDIPMMDIDNDCEIKYHVKSDEVPSFIPTFKDENDPEDKGFRSWHLNKLFPAKDSETKEMSSDNHRDRFNQKKNDLELSHEQVTHAGRTYAATTAIANGASGESVRALGIWSQPDSFSVYNHSLPVEAMVAAAGFNARHPESYFIARSLLDPPQSLLLSIFPWVEREQQALKDRIIADSRAEDGVLGHFLNMLVFLRCIILQDAAVLFQQFPDAPIWKYAPFNSVEFKSFSAQSTAIIQQAEESARQSLSNLPSNIANTFRGSMVTTHARQLEHQQIVQASTSHLSTQLTYLGGAVNSLATVLSAPTANPSRKRKAYADIKQSLQDVHIDADQSNQMCLVKRPHHDPDRPAKVPRLQLMDRDPNIDPALYDLDDLAVVSSESSNSAIMPQPEASHGAPLHEVAHTSQILPPGPLSLSRALAQSSVQPPLSSVTHFDGPSMKPPFASGGGNIYSQTTFPIDATNISIQSLQLKKILELEKKIEVAILRRHVFEWVDGEWLPVFLDFWKPPKRSGNAVAPTLEDLWTEYKHGFDGQMSLETLEQHWDKRWRRNEGRLRTEMSRRMKVISLIKIFQERFAWDAEFSIKFLKQEYPDITSTSRRMIEFLQKKSRDEQGKDQPNVNLVIAAAERYYNTLRDTVRE